MSQQVTAHSTGQKQHPTEISDPSTTIGAATCTTAPVCTASSSQCSSKTPHTNKLQQPILPSRPLSQRQACKGTFKRILQQQRQEDQAFAEFEAAVKLGKVTAPPAPAAPVVTEGGVVKKRRGRPPKPRPLIPVPTRPLFYGESRISGMPSG